jgi:Secretion system C-terminal sorting domain
MIGFKFHKIATSLSYLSSKVAWIVPCFFTIIFSQAQNIYKAEYFFDTDPGPGNGLPLTIASPGDPVTFTSSISTAGLEPGFHMLFVRTRTIKGWSLYEPREFSIAPAIEEAEYFFDTDPGVGNGTPFSTNSPSAFTETVSTAGLSPGPHVLFVRVKSFDGKWSHYQQRDFIINAITAAEYFVDLDPGFGNGIPLPITPGQATFNATISTAPLANGPHFLFVRTRHENGRWSLYEPQQFIVDTALPIELTSFTATVKDQNTVKLNWTTLTEINNDFFTVQHSMDGKEFKEIATVKGAGTSTEKHRYEELHNKPVAGFNYYRLKQTDFDGRSSYSKVVSVDIVSAAKFYVYPNPIDDKWFVEFSSELDLPILLEVFDLAGRKLFAHTAQEMQKVELNRQGFSSGTFLLSISTRKQKAEYRKLVFR